MPSAAELLAAERDKRADAVMGFLRDMKVRAERVDLSPSPSAGVNVWKDPEDRYPTTTIVVDDAEYSWGHNWEHTLSVNVDPESVASAVLAYLDAQEG